MGGQKAPSGTHAGHLLNRCWGVMEAGEVGSMTVRPEGPRHARQRWMMDEKLSTTLPLPMATVTAEGSQEGATGSLLAVFAVLEDEKKNRYYSLGWYAVSPSCHTIDLSSADACDGEEAFAQLQLSRVASKSSPSASPFTIIAGMGEFRESMLAHHTFSGVEPMGPFFSMRPVPGSRFGLRYAHVDVERPVVVHMGAFHVRRCRLADGGEGVRLDRFAATTVERWYFDAGAHAFLRPLVPCWRGKTGTSEGTEREVCV